MKIAIIGYGKMGKMIHSLAKAKELETVIVDPTAAEANSKTISDSALQGVDVAIEFTHPDAVVDNLKKLLQLKIPVVVGTTGWNQHSAEIQKLTEEQTGRLVHGSNYSVGMNITFQLAREAARRFSAIAEYEMAGVEIHHSQKKDCPSGTALELSKIVNHEYELRGSTQRLDFESVRVGQDAGTHTVLWDCAVDTVQITHRARNREGFASGALLAAHWLLKQKPGFYSFSQCMEGMTK